MVRMRRGVIAIVGLIAGTMLVVCGVTPAHAADPGPTGPFPTTNQPWTGGGTGGGPPGVTTSVWTGPLACRGQFRTWETDSGHMYWGGFQSCTSVATQTLQIDLYYVVGTGDNQHTEWVHGQPAYKVDTYVNNDPVEPCHDTTRTTYIQTAYGTVNGTHMTPWPQTSTTFTTNCYISVY